MAFLATPVSSSSTSASSIAAAESHSRLSLLAASFGSIPVSVDFAYNDFVRCFFETSTLSDAQDKGYDKGFETKLCAAN